MIAPAKDTKDRILSAAYRLLYKEGFARVSMDAIAEAAGVTKRTLYYHFDSKDTLTAAMLEHQHQHALAQIQEWGRKSSKTAADYLTALFEDLENWASQPRWLGSGFTRITMELAHLPGHPARHAANQHKYAVEVWLSSELKSLGAPNPQELARQVMLLIEGSMSLILIHGDASYAKSAARAAVHLIEAENASITRLR
jgi:AcrR family transcriptional regulator